MRPSASSCSTHARTFRRDSLRNATGRRLLTRVEKGDGQSGQKRVVSSRLLDLRPSTVALRNATLCTRREILCPNSAPNHSLSIGIPFLCWSLRYVSASEFGLWTLSNDEARCHAAFLDTLSLVQSPDTSLNHSQTLTRSAKIDTVAQAGPTRLRRLPRFVRTAQTRVFSPPFWGDFFGTHSAKGSAPVLCSLFLFAKSETSREKCFARKKRRKKKTRRGQALGCCVTRAARTRTGRRTPRPAHRKERLRILVGVYIQECVGDESRGCVTIERVLEKAFWETRFIVGTTHLENVP